MCRINLKYVFKSFLYDNLNRELYNNMNILIMVIILFQLLTLLYLKILIPLDLLQYEL